MIVSILLTVATPHLIRICLLCICLMCARVYSKTAHLARTYHQLWLTSDVRHISQTLQHWIATFTFNITCATHCNTLQHTATHFTNILWNVAMFSSLHKRHMHKRHMLHFTRCLWKHIFTNIICLLRIHLFCICLLCATRHFTRTYHCLLIDHRRPLHAHTSYIPACAERWGAGVEYHFQEI